MLDNYPTDDITLITDIHVIRELSVALGSDIDLLNPTDMARVLLNVFGGYCVVIIYSTKQTEMLVIGLCLTDENKLKFQQKHSQYPIETIVLLSDEIIQNTKDKYFSEYGSSYN